MQNIWSVFDLLLRNPHWWSPLICSAYRFNLDSRMLNTLLYATLKWFIWFQLFVFTFTSECHLDFNDWKQSHRPSWLTKSRRKYSHYIKMQLRQFQHRWRLLQAGKSRNCFLVHGNGKRYLSSPKGLDRLRDPCTLLLNRLWIFSG